jgi:anti-sigma regulatory factor (Ser/Thr protein kinase)
MTTEAALTVRNDVAELVRLNSFLEQFWAEHRLPEDIAGDVTLALEEVFLNVVNHGYTDAAEHDIVVRLALEEGCVALTVEDDGVPFNPLKAPAPDIDKPLEERGIGGLGIHLVRQVMDGIEYARAGGRNRLAMTKRIGAT